MDARGQLMLGPATELVYETASPFLWSVLAAADGTVYAGTGNDGRVYKVDAQGRGSVWFDAPELEVHALAPAPDGDHTLLRALLPARRIPPGDYLATVADRAGKPVVEVFFRVATAG